jgi:hypothetical protein
MARRSALLFLSILLMTACTSKGTPLPLATPDRMPVLSTPSATELPVVSPAAPTPEASATPEPTLVFPTPLPPAITLEPTATAERSPALSSAVIQILAPGPLSRVLTPIRLRGYVIPGYRSLIRVELYREDGTLIFRELMPFYADIFKWAYFTLDIPFETSAAAELARLQVSTDDGKGNTVALGAVHLLLQSEGFEAINPPGSLDERCILLTPLAGTTASGGSLTVAGEYRLFNVQPLIVELVTEDGAIVASQWFTVPGGANGNPMTFSADLAYSVDVPTSARLVVRQFDERINGNMYLYSQPVTLNP